MSGGQSATQIGALIVKTCARSLFLTIYDGAARSRRD